MKNNKHFLHFVVSVCAIFLCVACNGGNVGPGPSPDPDPPTPPDPPVPVESTTIVKARDINSGNTIAFNYEGEGDCVVDWGDDTNNDAHEASHTYLQSFADITITITGIITKINFFDLSPFCNNVLVYSIKLGDSVTTIPNRAFYTCNLDEITIPNSVTTVGENIFDKYSENLLIYCEAESKPSGWNENWNTGGSFCYWGFLNKDSDGNFNYIVTTAGVYIDKYIGTGTEVDVPSSHQDIPVKTINAKAFIDKKNIENKYATVFIPKGHSQA
mgnify:CR=1 FL=1